MGRVRKEHKCSKKEKAGYRQEWVVVTRACLCRYPESSPKSRHEKAVEISAAESCHFSGAGEAKGWLAQDKLRPCEKKRKSQCSQEQRTRFEKETWKGKGTCRVTLLGKSGINPISPRLREVCTKQLSCGTKRKLSLQLNSGQLLHEAAKGLYVIRPRCI